MKVKTYKRNTPLLVTFHDIYQNPKWQDNVDAAKSDPFVCWCVGLYTFHDEDSLIMSVMVSRGQRDKCVIPIGTIKRIQALSVKTGSIDIKA